MKLLNGKLITLLFVATILIWLLGGMVDVMDVDAAQYASISMEMLQTGSYLEVLEDGSAYLDKPPLLFWTAALSFKIFGISALAYKLPSILFALLAVLSVFGFAKTHYDERTASLAAIMLATTQAVFLITNDVRTDTLLTGSVALAIWQFSNYLIRPKWKYLFWGSVGIGLGMLAKGPLGLVIPAMALGTHALIRTRWDHIFKWQWLIALVIIAIILLPMCIGLYRQSGAEGLEFYFWTQSFGRITGENKWSDDSTYLFFTHTYLWAFLPWALISLPALWQRIKEGLKSFGKKQGVELISLGGVLLPFIALSLSQYKLPHYIFVIFPMASVIVASYVVRVLDEMKIRTIKALSGIQVALSVLLILITSLVFIPFGMPSIFLLIALFALLVVTVLIIRSAWNSPITRIVVVPILCILMANLLVSGHFYPKLLKYQAAGEAGKFIKENKYPDGKAYHYKQHRHALCFEARRIVHDLYNPEIVLKQCKINGPLIIYTDQKGKEELEQNGLSVSVIKDLDKFSVSQLNLTFLNPATREQELRRNYILEVDLPN